MEGLQEQLESTVVRPIFESVNGNGDQSLPAILRENRRRHAYGRVLDALVTRGVPTVPLDLRKNLESMVEKWSTQAFDDGFREVQEFELRCARDRDRAMAEASGDPRKVLEVLEREYRRRVVERFGKIELKGVQLNHRVILDLDEVFVPLRLVRARAAGETGEVLLAGKDEVPVLSAVATGTRTLVVGGPGSGKSTVVSFLASRFAAEGQTLPLVIVVREVKDMELTEAWLAELVDAPIEVLRSALAEDRALLLVDGMDEAPGGLRERMVDLIVRFAGQYPGSAVFVTSRPAGAPGETESCLPDFEPLRLADLTNAQVGEFIDKWCLAAEKSARPDLNEAGREAAAAAADLKARMSRSKPVQRIAVNPLLATILCVVHRYLGRTIPEHRVTLYDKCTDALLYEWDRAKFEKGSAVGELDANQKRALLRGVASSLHERHEAEIPETDVVQHFATMLPEMGKPPEDALRIVREIRDRSGLLVERRPGIFSFSHLTFQEYLTALDYALRPGELLTHVGEPWWDEVCALAVGGPGCSAEPVIRAFLERGMVVEAVRCLETAVKVSPSLRTEVEGQLARALPGLLFPGPERLQEIGLTAAPLLARDLPGYESPQKMRAVLFFASFQYHPAIPVLLEASGDSGAAGAWLELPPSGRHTLSIGELSVWALARMAAGSDAAKNAFATALTARPWSDVFLDWLKPGAVLGPDFKALRLEEPSSKPAKNTAPARRSKARPARSRSAK